MITLSSATRHKCFISYHHDDEAEVKSFIEEFDHSHDVFISRGIGASMPGDVINSTNADYIKQRIRQLYLRDSTVTIVMIGKCTWSRRFVDWEIAASLRNTSTSKRNGILAITLPSVANSADKKVPDRLSDNLIGDGYKDGYARWWKYPESTNELAWCINKAFELREKVEPVNSRPLMGRNRSCQ